MTIPWVPTCTTDNLWFNLVIKDIRNCKELTKSQQHQQFECMYLVKPKDHGQTLFLNETHVIFQKGLYF